MFAGKGEQIALDVEVRLRTEYPFEMNAQEAPRWRITAIWRGIRKRQNHLLGPMRRGVVGVIAAFVVVSMSFSAQAGEKKRIKGTDKVGPPISRTVVSPGDDPKHELAMTSIEIPPRVRTRIGTGQR